VYEAGSEENADCVENFTFSNCFWEMRVEFKIFATVHTKASTSVVNFHEYVRYTGFVERKERMIKSKKKNG
jgi:hypothetical protein